MAKAIQWIDAPELLKLAGPIMERFHPHLVGTALRFVWRSESRKLRGKDTAATAEIVSGRFAAYVMTDEEIEANEVFGFEDPMSLFWVEVGADKWNRFTEHQQLALIDHELSHFGIVVHPETGAPRMNMIPHDVEEFTAIAERWGAFDESRKQLRDAFNSAGELIETITPKAPSFENSDSSNFGIRSTEFQNSLIKRLQESLQSLQA
jgi:hypothetical protein